MAKTNEKKQKLTKEEVLHLANLVKLELNDDEVEAMQVQLGETLDYIQSISELDTTNVAETSHTTNAVNVTFEDGIDSPRTFSQDDALANARRKGNGFFIVEKILDK